MFRDLFSNNLFCDLPIAGDANARKLSGETKRFSWCQAIQGNSFLEQIRVSCTYSFIALLLLDCNVNLTKMGVVLSVLPMFLLVDRL